MEEEKGTSRKDATSAKEGKGRPSSSNKRRAVPCDFAALREPVFAGVVPPARNLIPIRPLKTVAFVARQPKLVGRSNLREGDEL
jgi:hypothetical protein